MIGSTRDLAQARSLLRISKEPTVNWRRTHDDISDDSRWQFDFATVLVLLVAGALLLLLTFELWLPHH